MAIVEAKSSGRWTCVSLIVGIACSVGDAAAQQTAEAWRFRHADKAIKVVALAGSIGAFPGRSYVKHLAEACQQSEWKNLSQTGLGAWALRRRFEEQAARHPSLRSTAVQERWLLYAGGLNSIANPHKTNREVRALLLRAHLRGFRVVAFTVTPWGDQRDHRWKGGNLKYRHATDLVADFVLQRLTPSQALGRYLAVRGDLPTDRWQPDELPDVAVDLYRSALRDEQGFLRQELRGFDAIHPNAEGHRQIAAIACPQLPPSWSCRCETLQ